MNRLSLVSLLLLASGAVLHGTASAGDGDLDPAFGPHADGRVTIGIDTGAADAGAQVVPIPGGGMYIVGSTSPGIGIVRLRADGTPDPDFAHVTYPADASSFHVIANAAVLADDGDLIVAGHYFETEPTVGPFWFACRFNADGSPDAFGNGALGPGCTNHFGSGVLLDGVIIDLVIQANNRIVFAGLIEDAGNKQRAAMSSLKPTGAIDLGFGNGNNLVVPLGNVVPESRYTAITRGAFGELLAVGEYAIGNGNSDMLITRHGATGALVEGFGSAGIVVQPIDLGPPGTRRDIASGIAFTQLGKITVAGSAQYETTRTAGVVVWLKANGMLDTTMGNSGIRKLQMSGTDVGFNDIVRGPRGRMIVGGSLASNADNPLVGIVAALNADGDFDPSFGSGGIAGFEFIDSVEMGTRNISYIVDLAVQNDKVLAAGYVASGDPANYDFAVARLGDGRLFADGLESDGP